MLETRVVPFRGYLFALSVLGNTNKIEPFTVRTIELNRKLKKEAILKNIVTQIQRRAGFR